MKVATRFTAAVPLALLLIVTLVTGSARAVSLFGEVIAVDPTAIQPGEDFEIELRFDAEEHEAGVFEGLFQVMGADVRGVRIPCGLAEVGACGSAIFRDHRLAMSISSVNRSGLILLLAMGLKALSGPSVAIDILGDELPFIAGRDTPSDLEEVLGISGRVPLDLRSKGVSLGTAVAIVPEPATGILLGIGLAILGGHPVRRPAPPSPPR